MKDLYVAVAMLVSLLGMNQVFAFGPAGHQETGAIADNLLEGTFAARQVHRLLGGRTLSEVSVWADCAKGVSPSFEYVNDNAKYPECVPFADDAPDFEEFVKNNWNQCETAHDSEQCHKQYHYADISSFEHTYNAALVGANTHDVVHAIDAAAAKLRGRPVPAPFWFKDDRQALMLLVHYVGDVHQPLHVSAIYLDNKGDPYNPDEFGYNHAYDTAGGNFITDSASGKLFHGEWDAVPEADNAGGANSTALVIRARQTHPTAGDLNTWAASWATDTLQLQARAFSGLRYTVGANSVHWRAGGIDDDYNSHAADAKFEQIAKGGARLAQLLQAIWPEPLVLSASACGSDVKGYLDDRTMPDIRAWLPPAPARGSTAERADIDAYLATRALLASGNPRGERAAQDDVYDPPAVLSRFQASLGIKLTDAQVKGLITLLCKAEKDADRIVSPVKLKTRLGGRIRPFVEFPDLASCISPIDMAGHAKEDLGYQLPATGSYPSGHALLGMLTGLTLSQVSPDHSDELIACGIEFGESRLVCGFHYPSDLAAGRLTASVLFAALLRNSDFQSDLDKIVHP